METTEQPSAPACYKCDDIGYTTGNEVFNVARCDCPIGAKADMRGVPGAITGSLRLNAGPTDIVFGNGALRLDSKGFAYNGEIIKDAGRAYRTFIATMEGRKPDAPLLERAYDLIDEARDAGQVLTIDLVPLKPLAMGHYEMVADLRPARERALTGRVLMAEFELDLARPLQTMAFHDRRTEARKVIWPVPDPKNFTLERRDAFSTLTDEQFDKRQSDRRKREAK